MSQQVGFVLLLGLTGSLHTVFHLLIRLIPCELESCDPYGDESADKRREACRDGGRITSIGNTDD